MPGTCTGHLFGTTLQPLSHTSVSSSLHFSGSVLCYHFSSGVASSCFLTLSFSSVKSLCVHPGSLDHWRQKPMHNVHLPLFCCLGGEFQHFLRLLRRSQQDHRGSPAAAASSVTLLRIVSFSSIFYGCPLVVVPKQTPCTEDSTSVSVFRGNSDCDIMSNFNTCYNAAFLSFPTLGILGSLLKHQEHITLFFCPSISDICFFILLVNK